MSRPVVLCVLLCMLASCRALMKDFSGSFINQGQTKDQKCQVCWEAAQAVEDVAWDPRATESLTQTWAERVCPMTTSFEDGKCVDVGRTVVSLMVQWLRTSATAESLCRPSDVCPVPDMSDTFPAKWSARVRGDASGCAMCLYVVKAAKDALGVTHDDVTAALQKAKEACVQLPADLATPCANVVDTYGPILTFLLADMDADQACQAANICPAQAGRARPAPLPQGLARLLRALKPFVVRPSPEAELAAASASQRLKDESCDVCKMAVMEARTIVTDPNMQATIMNYTLSLCDSFPTFAAECKLYVNAYGPLVFSLLDVYLVPDVLCAQIGVCPPPAADYAHALRSVRRRSLEELKLMGWSARPAA